MEQEFTTKYCKECNKDVPVEHLDDGTIIIHCPKCTGECVTCGCHLVKECFSNEKNVRIELDK